jgi:glycosyltransferase involved in cell wall biosynthesis
MFIVGARGFAGTEGGIEKFAEEFVKRASRRLDITAIVLENRQPDSHEAITVISARKSHFLRTDKLRYYLSAIGVLTGRKFDYLFLLGINSAFIGLVARILSPKTRVIVRSGSIDYKLDKWGMAAKLYFRMSEQCARFAHRVISVSPSIHRHLEAMGIGSVLVRNGLERMPLRQLPERTTGLPTVLAVGRVTTQKNYKVLIDAAHALQGRVNIRIVGGADKTDEFSRLQAYMAEKKITNVELSGQLHRSEVYEQMSNADIFINCSMHEGMSNSVLEAIQFGLPLILSDIDANTDLALPGHHYFSAYQAADLARVISEAVDDQQKFVVEAEKFPDWDAVVATILESVMDVEQESAMMPLGVANERRPP